uniref:U-box domain-containing protein n=1 Tax=Ananas comosus var. bracteatus TaxID=296719 RepID=A0A6V7QPX7_ANACO
MAAQGTEIIAELLQQIQSLDSPEGQTAAALHSLSSLTKVSSHNRKHVAAAPGAVPLLLSLISAATPSSTHTQTLSLSILFNLSLNTNLKLSLAQTPNLITLLNSILLSSKTPHAAKLAASLLCSLAMLDKNKAPLGVAGTVEVIVEALRCSTNVSSSSPANHHLLSALAELLHFHGNCTLAVRAGVVPLLVGNLESPPEELAGSFTVLGLLARFDEGIEAIMAVDGVVSLMVDGLRKGCTVSRESAAEILIKLFEESGECLKEAALNHDEWSSLLADLSVRGSARAREKAAVLMRMMMENDLDGYLDMEGNYMD